LFFSGLQHMLLVVSLSLALPLTIAQAAGLSTVQSSALLATTLFMMAVTTVLQSMRLKWLGSGYQSISAADSASISPCLLAVQVGGMPLVWGMTVFSGLTRALLSFGTRKLRRFFPPEVTGCSIFILGISLIPSTMKNFLGTASAAGFQTTHLAVAFLSFLTMLVFAVLLPKFRLYAVILGIFVGYGLSFLLGIVTPADFSSLAALPVFALPVPKNYSLAFDMSVILPFLVISMANTIDNIGDFSAAQSASYEKLERLDWESIANGSRASALGTMLSGLAGGSMMSTATGNIGVMRATGVASRKVAYLAAGLMAVCSFLPGVTGVLSMMPHPVLGAILLYSACYIMAGGFETLTSRVMDDRRVFTVFASLIIAISTLIPGLYDFIPQELRTLIVSPVTLGMVTLVLMSVFMRIGRKKKFSFVLPATAAAARQVDEKINVACAEWCAPQKVCQKLKIGITSLLEGIEEQAPGAELSFVASYDEMRICFRAECAGAFGGADDPTQTLGVAVMMMRGMFSGVRVECTETHFLLELEEDV